jgi:hypothetical protein
MKQEIIVYLRLLSDNNSPEEISSRIKISSAKSWKQGEKNQTTKMLYQENGWEIKSNLGDEIDVVKKIVDVLSLIEPYKKEINLLKENWDVEIACVIYYSEPSPPLNFDASLLRQIGEVGASLDIDIYNIEG